MILYLEDNGVPGRNCSRLVYLAFRDKSRIIGWKYYGGRIWFLNNLNKMDWTDLLKETTLTEIFKTRDSHSKGGLS